MTRSHRIIISLFFSVLLTFQVRAGEPAFKPGEEIHYKILQMGIKVGEATLKFVGPTSVNSVDTFLIEFTADGFNFYDKESIYVDPESFKPLTVKRDLNIFGKREKIEETYFPQDNKIIVAKTVKGVDSEQVLIKSGEVDNIYGFIYRYRSSGGFRLGDQLDVTLPTKDIKMSVVKRSKLNIEGTQRDVFYLESKPSQYKLWFEATPKSLPLRISGAIGLANTVMVLNDYKE